MTEKPIEQYYEYQCPYDAEPKKIKGNIIGVTIDYCESSGGGRGCSNRDNCIAYICAKKKQMDVIISEKQESI